MVDRRWYHTIDLPDGGATPGWIDTRELAAGQPWDALNVQGRCLDVGTWDGFWAFELERRGADEVVAIDVTDPYKLNWRYDFRESGPREVEEWGSTQRNVGLLDLAEQFDAKVTYEELSIYDLDPDVHGMFDVVLVGNLILHLQDPVRALEAVRSVTRGRLLLLEVIDPGLELRMPRRPAALVQPVRMEWQRYNSAGVRRILDTAGFEVVAASPHLLQYKGPGAVDGVEFSRLAGVIARRPGKRGILTRGFVASPRPPREG